MSKDRLRAHALKKIVNSPGCTIEAEALLEELKKIDRTCSDLVLSKFIPVISTIPLIETKDTTFSLTRSAAKGRSYYMMLTLLFGNRAISQWPDIDKLVSSGISKANNVKLAHFINSYCVQTIPQDKLSAYNAQMSMLIYFIIKSGNAKEVLYDKIIMDLVVPYFPTLSLNWVVLFNLVIKEPRPNNLVQPNLTTEKAISLFTKLIRKIARDCEMELNRPTTQSANVTTMNYADVAKDTSKASARSRQNSVPSPEKVSEGIPMPASMFPLITGVNGSGLREIEAETGAVVTVGNTRNGESGFLVRGTPDQNSRAIEKIFKMVYREEKKDDNTENIITYASDILKKFMADKEWARKLVMLPMLEPHIHCVINVEPYNQQVLVKGPPNEREALTEAVRDLLSDFAADLIKRGRAPPKPDQAELPAIQLFSLGSEHNVLIRVNSGKILEIANTHHISLTFPGSSHKNILTLSGRKKNIKEADQAISALLKSEADYALAALLRAKEDKKASPKPSTAAPPSTAAAPSTAAPPSTAAAGTKSNNMLDYTPMDWEDIETGSSKNDYWFKDDGKICERYEDMGLNPDILTSIYNNGLKTPSYLQSHTLFAAIKGIDMLIQCPHSSDLLTTLTITLLQTLDTKLTQTQVLLLVANKDHLTSVKCLVELLGEYSKIKCHISLDSKDEPLSNPLVIVSTLTRVKELIDKQLLDPKYIKLMVVVDADVKVGYTGYKEFQQELTSIVEASMEPQLIIHSSTLSKKLKDIIKGVTRNVCEVEVKEEQLQNIIPVHIDKQITRTIPSNIPVTEALLLKTNIHLVQDIVTEHDIKLEFAKDGTLSLKGKCDSSLNTALGKITDTLVAYQKAQNDKLGSIVCILSPAENTYLYQNRQVVADIVKGYKIAVQYGHFESDNIELTGKVSSINTASNLISEAVKHHINKTQPGGNFAEFFQATPTPKKEALSARRNSDKDLAALVQEGQSKVNTSSKPSTDMSSTPQAPVRGPSPACTSVVNVESTPVLPEDVPSASTKQPNSPLPISETDKSVLVDPTGNPFDFVSPNSKRKIKPAKPLNKPREPKIDKPSPSAQPKINSALSELQDLQSKSPVPQSSTISTPSFEIVENVLDENGPNNPPSMPTALEPIRAPHESSKPVGQHSIPIALEHLRHPHKAMPVEPHSVPTTPEPITAPHEIPKPADSPQIGKYVPPGLRETNTPVKLHEPGFTTVESSRTAYIPPSLRSKSESNNQTPPRENIDQFTNNQTPPPRENIDQYTNNQTPPPRETINHATNEPINQPIREPYIPSRVPTEPSRSSQLSAVRESTPSPSPSQPSTPSQQPSTSQRSNLTPNRPPRCLDTASDLGHVVQELEYPECPAEMLVENSVDAWIYKKVRSRMLYPPQECPYIIHITLSELVQDFMSEFPAARSQEKALFTHLLQKLQSASTYYHLKQAGGNLVITLVQRKATKKLTIRDPITLNNVIPDRDTMLDRASPSHPTPSMSHPTPLKSYPSPSLPSESHPTPSEPHPTPSESHPTPPVSQRHADSPPAAHPMPSSYNNPPSYTQINTVNSPQNTPPPPPQVVLHTTPRSTPPPPTNSTNGFKSEFGVGTNFADFLDGDTPTSLPPPIQPSPPMPVQQPRAPIQQDQILVNISEHADVPVVIEHATASSESVTVTTENLTAVAEDVTTVTETVTTEPESVTIVMEDLRTSQSSSSSGTSGEFVVCNKSESESSLVLIEHESERVSAVSSLSSLAPSQTDNTTETSLTNQMEGMSLDNRSDTPDTILYLSNQPSDSAVGVTADKKYLCINCATPGTIAVLGADMPTKYAIIKRVVDVWVGKNLPVFVVSPKLETVTQHKDVDFYPFKSLAGSTDQDMVVASQEFLHSHDEMKLFVLNTSHKAVNTDDFLEWLLAEYYSLNTVVLSVCVPDPATFTALLSSWKRCKNDEIWKGFVEDHDLSEDVSPETIKRGTVLAYSLDGASVEPIICKPC